MVNCLSCLVYAPLDKRLSYLPFTQETVGSIPPGSANRKLKKPPFPYGLDEVRTKLQKRVSRFMAV